MKDCFSKNSERNSSIELMRILLALSIVVLHYCDMPGRVFDLTEKMTINGIVMHWIYCLCRPTVNIFILISGYYLHERNKVSTRKLLELYIEYVLIEAIFCVAHNYNAGLDVLIVKLSICLLPRNYYLVLYSIVYILSPFINRLIKELDKKELKKLVFIIIFVFGFWNTCVNLINEFTSIDTFGLSTIGQFGTQWGFTIVNFIMLYIVGAYIHIVENNLLHVRGIWLLFALIVTTSINCVISLLEPDSVTVKGAWSYNNPLIIVSAVIVFCFFIRLRFMSKIINRLSGAAFTAFLLGSRIIDNIKLTTILAKGNIFILCLHMLACCFIVFVISYIFSEIYRAIYSRSCFLVSRIHRKQS